MYGFPTRRAPARAVPTAPTRFDPSGDARCTGWWRADRGVGGANGKVETWTNILSPYQAFAHNSGQSAILTPRMTNGFPALHLTSGMGNYSVSGLAQAGDTECTLTYVMRWPYSTNYNGNTHISFGGQNVQLGLWDNWIRVWAVGNWRDWWGGWYYPCGLRNVAVVTVRVQNSGSERAFSLGYNSGLAGPTNISGQQAAGPTSELQFYAEARRAAFLHEIIFFRAALTDAEVRTMHALLQRQYGAA
jgi:hypothetical protein